MKVYHGTNFENLHSILENGIIPRGDARGNWEKYPSRTDMVYLSVAYPFYFGIQAAETEGKCVVFEVETDYLDESHFYPDEDYVAQVISGDNGESLNSIHGDVRDNLGLYKHHWESSLELMGSLSYNNEVPSMAITRYCIYNPIAREHLTVLMLDPSISMMNYMILGDYYRAIVSWMFGDLQDLPIKFIAQDIDGMKEYWEDESSDRSGIRVEFHR